MPDIITAAVFGVTRRAGLSSSVVEQRTCNAQVVSSILTGGSRSIASQYYLSARGVQDVSRLLSVRDALSEESLAANDEYTKILSSTRG
jgi:hypothetical protein